MSFLSGYKINISDILLVKVFEIFNIAYVRKFLKLNKNKIFLNDLEIHKFKDNDIDRRSVP